MRSRPPRSPSSRTSDRHSTDATCPVVNKREDVGLIGTRLAGGLSLINGNTFGRIIAIIGASLGAIAALFSISGPNPWWSLAVFFLCIYVIHGIFIYGDDAADLNP